MRIIIIGAGFSGIAAFRSLARLRIPLDIIIFDKKETFDFLPLLPDCFAREIDPLFISSRIDNIARKYGTCFINQEVIELDLKKREVLTKSSVYSYDYLIITSGTQANSYGNDRVKKYAYTLDSAQDLKKLINAFSRQYDNFVVAGAGYSGIEVACGLRRYLKSQGKNGKVIIVERAASILGPLPDWMKAYVLDNLKALGIEVFTNTTIDKIEESSVCLSTGAQYNNSMLIWAAGVCGADFIQKLPLEKNPQGRLKVNDSLKVFDCCFAAGDAACFSYNGMTLRMAVQFALTQGEFVASQIMRSIKGKELKAYKPLDLGYVIPMANNKACGQVLGRCVKDKMAIFLHFFMCIYRLWGWRNKVGVLKFLVRRCGMTDVAILILRLCLAIVFIGHGLQASFGLFSGPGLHGFSQMLASLGFKHTLIWAYIAACSQLIGGVCLLTGFWVRASAALLLIFITVAGISAHLSKGFFIQQGGFEYTFVLACICLALMMLGAGKYAIK